MKNLCIIPARSGSKGVPGKNIKPLNGKLLINYTYEAALNTRLIDKIILTTDSAEIADTAPPFVHVPFIRPAHLALDNTPSLDVLKHALSFLEECGQSFENIILLQPTCPFRSKGFVDRCIKSFVASGADSLVSVKQVPHEYNPHWVFEADNSGFLQIATGEKKVIPSRQSLPPAYIRDGSVYVFKGDNISHQNSIYGKTITYLESDNLWHVNIDTTEDWKRAELIANMMSLQHLVS